ncbi:MAG TPA: pitrilysin family protein, partial [Vicinamibacterales bacterium]|nr:pitrilysin family protein [Vicinamibacterales bacterium]
MIVREVFPNGVRLITETMDHVRSVSVGVWLTRGSRHEPIEHGGIAHFVEHMLFKGTATRSAEDIAQQVDSLGGHLDAFTSKEYAGYYIKVLDEHLPTALDVLSDLVLHPAFKPEDVEREKKVILEEIKMVEDTPDDLVHELFTQSFWDGHPLGRPILGLPDTVNGLTSDVLRSYFNRTYTAGHLVIVAVGNVTHEAMRDLVMPTFGALPASDEQVVEEPPAVVARALVRVKELEQSHVCLGTSSYPQNHDHRYAAYVLNTMLGGSMSSRLFQNVREKRGLAYAVFSGLSAYRDAGNITIYAGCANEAVGQVIDLCVEELRGMKRGLVPDAELRRAKDHLKGSLMLSLENTASRMSHLARQEIYFDRHFGLDETLSGVERVSTADVQRVAQDLFSNGSL